MPLGSCVCNFVPLMEKVGRATSNFKDSVEVQMKSTKSPEASKYGVQDMCVVVDGVVKLSSNFDEKELEDAILRRKSLHEGRNMKNILFVCVENAGRSQMAEAFANQYGKGKLVASSAGVMLADRVNPLVVEAMMEKGIDISTNKPKLLTTAMAEDADKIITMGCSVEKICPAPLLKNVIDWDLEDPKGRVIEKVRQIRDEIKKRVLELTSELGD